MLYDRRWEKKADPFTMDAVAEWLETKSGEYNYCDPKNCLAAQYNRSIGRRYSLSRGFIKSFFMFWSFDAKLERLGQDGEWTFEAARERLRA